MCRHSIQPIRRSHSNSKFEMECTKHKVQMSAVRRTKLTEKKTNAVTLGWRARPHFTHNKMELFESFKVIDTKAFCVLFAYVIYRTVCELVPSSSFFFQFIFLHAQIIKFMN